MKEYNFNGLSGCVTQATARSTGTLVGIYHALQAGIETYGWATVCEEHSTLIIHETLKQARWHAPYPNGWCEVCDKNLEERG